MKKCKKILIVGRYALYRAGVKIALQNDRYRRTRSIYEAASISESVEKDVMDLIVLDVQLLDLGRLWLFKRFINRTGTPVLVMSECIDSHAYHMAQRIGVCAMISYSASLLEVSDAAEKMLAGESCRPKSDDISAFAGHHPLSRGTAKVNLPHLTKREKQVLKYLCDGMLNKQISYKLGISENTVKSHVSKILRKSQVSSRTQLVISMV